MPHQSLVPASAVLPARHGPKSVVEDKAVPKPQCLQGNRDEPIFQHEELAVGHGVAEQRDRPVIRSSRIARYVVASSLAWVVLPAAGSPTSGSKWRRRTGSAWRGGDRDGRVLDWFFVLSRNRCD